MPESPTSPRRLTVAQKQAEALKLRASGMSFPDIAKKLGYKNRNGAFYAVTTALQKTLQEPADELRVIEAERLDRMLEGIWDKAINGGTWQIDRVLNIMDRRAKLLGLDKPATEDTAQKAQMYLDLLEMARSDARDMSE